MDTWDCIVIGAGPAGSTAARYARAAGARTLLLDRRRRPGWPVQCGEAVSMNALTAVGLTLEDAWVVRAVRGARVLTPAGHRIRFPREGVCIRRDVFDDRLVALAASQGCDVHVGEGVEACEQAKQGWRVVTSRARYAGRAVIVAHGAGRCLPGVVEHRAPDAALLGFEYKFAAADVRAPYLDFHHGAIVQPGYGWRFDRGDHVSIGVYGPDRAARTRLDTLCRRLGYDPAHPLSRHAGWLPCGAPRGPFAHENMLWAGDAAGLAHPLTKGGIHMALLSGRWAGEAVGRHVSGADSAALDAYGRRVDGVAREFCSLHRGSRWLYGIADGAWDLVGNAMAGGDVDDVPWGRLLCSALADPRQVPLLLRFGRLLRAYRRTRQLSW